VPAAALVAEPPLSPVPLKEPLLSLLPYHSSFSSSWFDQ
jgi:hypothetical protein